MEKEIEVSALRAVAPSLSAFDKVLLTGTVYTARDAAHKRFFTLLDEGRTLPIELKDAVIYYAGPTPTPQGMAIGSCGPTTAGRMDRFVPRLMQLGMVGMIGKGERDEGVRQAIVQHGGVYFCAIGGAGALAAACVKSCEVVAFDDLGCESVKKLHVERFPLIVAIDSRGNDVFKLGKALYRAKQA